MAQQIGNLTRIGRRNRRRGVVLYIVVTIVLLVTLITYTLLIAMRNQNLAAALSGDRLQARQSACSARDVLLSMLEDSRRSRDASGGVDSNHALFSRIDLAVQNTELEAELPFGVIVSTDSDKLQFGAINESGKINLRVLLDTDRKLPGSGRIALMRLPDMTESIADHVLDWIDADDESREFGNESPFYLEKFGYPARNGIPPVLEECIRISEVAQRPMSGQTSRQRSKSFEQQAERKEIEFPPNGRAAPPWAEYLTVSSAERNESYSGFPRIDLNQSDLFLLHQLLVEHLDLEIANFVILYRQFGQATSHFVGSDVRISSRSPADLTIDFSNGGLQKLDSPLDLINATIEIRRSSKEIIRVESPVLQENGDFMEKLPKILDFCTITGQESLVGRVNINIAPREVLLSVPGIDESIADRMIAAQFESTVGHRDVSWLLIEQVLSLDTFRETVPFINAGGDVYRARFVGFANHRNAPYVFEAVLDATGSSAKQLGFTRINETFEYRTLLNSDL